MDKVKRNYMNGDIVRVVSEIPKGIIPPKGIEKYLGTMQTINMYEHPTYYTKTENCYLRNELIAGYVIFTKSNLRTGDIVKCSDGQVYMVNVELGALIGKKETDYLDRWEENLTRLGCDSAIVAVRRPIVAGHCTFDAFKLKYGELVYDRDKEQEMTIDEVSQLLGQKIKIIERKVTTE
jgi:hypothetical protein